MASIIGGSDNSLSLASQFLSGSGSPSPEAGAGAADGVVDLDGSPVEDLTSVSLTDIMEEDNLGSADEQTPGTKLPTDGKSGKPGSSSKPAGSTERLAVDKGKGFIDIDYNDKERIKKAFLMEHGARKWQAEKDQATKKASELGDKFNKLNSHWSALEGAFQDQGIEGVIDLLEGKPGAYQGHIAQQLKKHDFLRNATPDEKQALEAREMADKNARELDKMRRENTSFREKIEKEREAAEYSSMESKVHPSFEKWRFSGKLGDPNDEHMFDDMLWNTALRKLAPYEEQGVAVTPEMIDKSFSETSRALRKRISGYGEKVAARTVEKKKEVATEQVQSAVRSGYKGAGNKAGQEARDLLNKGDIQGLLSGWGTFGSAFGKRK